MKPAIAFLFCTAAARSPHAIDSDEETINGGVPTTGYPYVIRIRDPATGICSSTLIGPRVLLTAAHCVGNETNLEPDIGNTKTIATAKHPTRDVAVAILEHRLELATITPSFSPLTMDRIGDPVQMVGFGLTGHWGEGYNSGKHAVWDQLRRYDANLLMAGRYDAGPCSGDSGGPAIMSDAETGEEKVYGILASTWPGANGESCVDVGNYERLDTIRDWLEPHLASCGKRGGTTCELNGNEACGGVGVYSPDCDMCCGGATTEPLSCGTIGGTKCEIGGNNACGGKGAPTSDCDFCCK